MIVAKHVVPSILSGRVTQLWQPTTRWSPKRTDRLRSAHLERDPDNPDKVIRRWAGTEPFARVKITRYEQVMLDDLTDRDAKAGGYSDVGHMMREWFDAFGLAWTGQAAWQLTFEIDLSEPVRPMRVAWDPGSSVDDVGAARRRAPEPEEVDHRPMAEEAQRKWELDQAQRQALYDAMPLDQKLKLVQQDDNLRILGKDDLRVIERRLEAIWNKGNRKAA